MAGKYDTIDLLDRTQQLPWYETLINALVGLSDIKPTDKALDVGCGPGALSRKLAPRVQELRAVDRSSAMLQKAKERADQRRLKNLSYEIGDPLALPFSDNEFNLVFAAARLFWLEKPLLALNEMARVARPGGQVLAWDPSIEMRPERFRLYVAKKSVTGFAFEALYDWLGAAEANHRFSRADYERLFQKAGLTNVTVVEELDRMVLIGKGYKPK